MDLNEVKTKLWDDKQVRPKVLLVGGVAAMALILGVTQSCDKPEEHQSAPKTSATTVEPVTTTVSKPMSPNDQYLKIIRTHAMGLEASNTTLIGLGHAVCDDLTAHLGDRSLTQQKLANKWDSENDAEWVITASAVAYCPEFILPSDRW